MGAAVGSSFNETGIKLLLEFCPGIRGTVDASVMIPTVK